jgi:polyhydroxybutyrate depolymerase
MHAVSASACGGSHSAASGETSSGGAGGASASTAQGNGGAGGSVELPYPVGETDDTIEIEQARRFRVYVPESASMPPRALVMVLHGGGGEGLDVSVPGEHALAVFRDVADREGFVVVYPEGLPTTDGRAGWVDCRSDNALASGADDIGFLRALLEQLRDSFSIDVSRTFLTGTSNGGQMTLAFIAHAANEIGAIATCNANLPESPLPGPCTSGPQSPVAALLTHGTVDPAMPYDGGCVANLGGACARGRVVGAEATRDAFLALDGLATAPTASETVDVDLDDSGPAQRFVHDGQVPVEWWRMDGGGHPIPSTTILTPTTAAAGPQNRDVEFAEVAWSFFASRL